MANNVKVTYSDFRLMNCIKQHNYVFLMVVTYAKFRKSRYLM